MGRRLLVAALWVLALVPSGWLAWKWRAMPHLGLHQDDAIYLVGAKSLAEGRGYRIESLPGEPFQTKYPPVVSLLLAPLWKFGPGFPENLKLATLFTWLMLLSALWMAQVTFRHFGLSPKEVWILTLAAAWHPVICLLSTAIMSDLLFLTLFLGSLMLAERALTAREAERLAVAAGAIAGVAYLTRTAALPLLVTATFCFWRRKQWRRGFLFLAGMAPAVVGWQTWTTTHMLQTRDPVWLYYTSYLGMERLTVRFDNWLLVLWHNADALLRAVGKWVVFDVALLQNVHLERVLGVAAIAGVCRLGKRSGRCQYPAAAAGVALLLLAHHFTPDERLALPLYPLVLMGFWTEAKNFCGALRKSWNCGRSTERGVAIAGAAALAGLFAFWVGAEAVSYRFFLPSLYATCRRDLHAHQPAYDWIRKNTPAAATFYAYDDSVLYLYTGRHALGMPMPPGRVYSGHAEREADRFILSTPQQARAHGLDYLFVTTEDFYRERRAGLLLDATSRDSRLRREFACGRAVVYDIASRLFCRAGFGAPSSSVGELLEVRGGDERHGQILRIVHLA